MISQKFSRCHEVTAKWEGGWSNHPDDPGGATMFGVIQAVYDEHRDKRGLPRQSVRKITRDEALGIFFNNYWLASGCDTLHPGVDLATYDASVNSGVGRGRKWLAASVGSADHSVTVKRICQKRLSFVQGLRTFKTFGKGWSRRIADVQAKGVAWALAAMHGPVAAGDMLEDEASASAKTAKTQERAGGGTGVATGAGGADIAVNPDHAAQLGDWLTYGLIAAGVLVAAVLIVKAIRNRDQADAYLKEARQLHA